MLYGAQNQKGGFAMKNVLKMMVCVLLLCFLWAAPCLAQDAININTATVEQLTELPGIGPAIAAKIVEYRTAHPFATVEEVMEVKGIGPAKYEAIKDRITVVAPPTKKE